MSGSRTDKLYSQFMKLRTGVKKAVADLNKKPGDKKLIETIRNGIIAMKKIRDGYDAAAKQDEKEFDGILKEINPAFK